jgi:hypothetical protein
MENSEIIRFWGKDLIQWPKTAVDTIAIPEPSRTFLAEVGLPCPKDPLWIYEVDDGRPPVRMPENPKRVRIAHKPRPICLDEDEDGAVVMPLVKRNRERFVNSSVQQFAAFLILEESIHRELGSVGDEITSSRKILSRIEETMRQTDDAALNDTDTYWSCVLEGMWYPFLSDEEIRSLAKRYGAP